MSELGTGDGTPMPQPQISGEAGPEGPQISLSDMVEAFSRMSPKDREGNLAQLPPQLREVVQQALGSSDAVESAVDGVKNDIEESNIEELENKQHQKDILSKQFKKIAPDLEDEKRDALISSLSDIGDESEILTSTADTIADHLKEAGFNRYQAEKILLTKPNLSDTVKQRILDQFPEMTEEAKAEAEAKDKMSETEATIKGKIADVARNKVESTAAGIESGLDERIANETDESKKQELIKAKARVNGLLTRFKDIFGPETEGRKWARRVGKTMYFSLLALFLIIILEMNMINKMSKRQGR